MHTISIVEQDRGFAVAVSQEPVEPSVQSGWKRWIFFVEVYQIGGPV